MKYVIYIFAEILDILAFIFLFMFPTHFYSVLIFHSLMFIIGVYTYKKFDNTISDLPLYLILLFPVFGWAFISLFYFSSTYFYRDNLPLSDYEQMLEADIDINLREKISYENEIRTMSFLDLLNYISPEQKKELLINSQYGLSINNTEILKKGLNAKDKEVQHYSATLLNTKENDFTNKISYLSEQYNDKKSPLVLDNLSQAYLDYIESGLIEEDSMGIFIKEYIDTLCKKIEINRYDLDTLNALFKAYVNDNNLRKAQDINNKINKEFNRADIVALNRLLLLYEKNNYYGVYNVITTLDPEIINSNEKLKEIKSFYTKGVI